GHALGQPGLGADLELLVELANAPLPHHLDRGGVGEAERDGDVATEQVSVPEARQLEDATSCREHPSVRVAHDEPGRRCRVVVLEELEQEAESALAAL